MKAYISLVLGLLGHVLSAQQSPQTIYCNEHQNVALVMNAPIAQAVTGSENFIFTYNHTAVDSLGLLQGRPGTESNLLIRTTDGGLYSYILKYKDTLTKFVHFIKPQTRINPIHTEKDTIKVNQINRKSSDSKYNDRYYKKFSQYYLNRNPQKLAVRRKAKLKLEVQGLYYYRDDVFMVIEIGNRSKIDFKVEDVTIAKIHGSKSRKSSYQKEVLKDLYRKDFPELVTSGSQKRFVMIFPKFTLGDHEHLEVILTENSGSRYLKLKF